MLTLRMAWRNLWRHKRRTWLTTTGMVFSNVILVFMISLQLGSYEMMIDNTLRAFSGYVQVQAPGYLDKPKIRNSIPRATQLAEQIRAALPEARVGVRAFAFALASSKQRSLGIQIVGVQPRFENGVSTVPGLLKDGRFPVQSDAPEMVIGAVMARNLKVGIGDEITLLGSGRDGSFAAGVVTVAGIFESGMREMDRGLAEVPLGWFQDTFAMGDQAHSIVVSLDSLREVTPAVATIRQVLPADGSLVVLDWMTLQPGLKQAIIADMSSAWFMYGVLIILVALSVMNTQLMSVLERTREFGMLAALGLRPRKLASLVLLETVLMALLGLALGIFFGWLLTRHYAVTGFSYPGMEELADRFNLPGKMYPSVSWISLLLGPSVVFIFSLLAALYPAARLFRLEPVAAMRAA